MASAFDARADEPYEPGDREATAPQRRSEHDQANELAQGATRPFVAGAWGTVDPRRVASAPNPVAEVLQATASRRRAAGLVDDAAVLELALDPCPLALFVDEAGRVRRWNVRVRRG